MLRTRKIGIPWIALFLLGVFHLPVHAFSTVDEQIDHYLQILNQGGYTQKIEMLKQLQWSAISDPRLYDPIAVEVESQYLSEDLEKRQLNLTAHAIRALGYSGNDKYHDILSRVVSNAGEKKLRKHAKKAQVDLNQFSLWNTKIRLADAPVEGKDVEIATYMRMLSVAEPEIKRVGARAVFHQRLNDPELIALAAQQLEAMYIQPGLDKTGQDTVAWLCKAVGQAGDFQYVELLGRVAADSPYKKVRKHAKKYAQ